MNTLQSILIQQNSSEISREGLKILMETSRKLFRRVFRKARSIE